MLQIYIPNIYSTISPPLSLSLGPPPQSGRVRAHTFTRTHTLPHNRRNGPLCGRSPRPLLPTLAHPHLTRGLRRRSRGCTYVSCIRLSSAIYSRATRATLAGGGGRGGQDVDDERSIIYEGRSALPIKRIMNRAATSFFPLFLRVAEPGSAVRQRKRERVTINNDACFAHGAP